MPYLEDKTHALGGLEKVFCTENICFCAHNSNMADDCIAVTVVDRVTEFNTLGGFVFLVFLACLILGIIFGLLLARCILRELEVCIYLTNY